MQSCHELWKNIHILLPGFNFQFLFLRYIYELQLAIDIADERIILRNTLNTTDWHFSCFSPGQITLQR